MPNGWEALVGELQNKYDPKTSAHKVKNVCKQCCIYGKADGVLYASHPAGFKLESYTHEVEQEDGSMNGVAVDEFKCAVAAAAGNRGGGNQGAGIRMGNTKFMMIRPSPEVDHGAYLSRQGGGGATVTSTDKCIIVGIWDKDMPMSNKQMQNTGDCADVVEKMTKFLKKQGM